MLLIRICGTQRVRVREFRSSDRRILSLARVRLPPHRALVNRAAKRLGLAASIPRAGALVLLAGGTRERGSPAAIAITAPFPGALLNRSRRCTRTRVPLRVAMLTLSGCHFSEAMRHSARLIRPAAWRIAQEAESKSAGWVFP